MTTRKAVWSVLVGLSMTVFTSAAAAGADRSSKEAEAEAPLARVVGNPLAELKALTGGFSFPIAWKRQVSIKASIPGKIEDYLIENNQGGIPPRDPDAHNKQQMGFWAGVGGNRLDRSYNYAHLFPAWELHLQLHSDFTFGSLRDRLTPPAWERALSSPAERPDPGLASTGERGD